jgi:hypothetical protein
VLRDGLLRRQDALLERIHLLHAAGAAERRLPVLGHLGRYALLEAARVEALVGQDAAGILVDCDVEIARKKEKYRAWITRRTPRAYLSSYRFINISTSISKG